ncbi:hypothetical protein ETD83_30300 [Actinomadura soli]|uniref:Uncharacterized protein n=1 Tax=Actinomadura soli TaxID=2508997 RepID=A0A5C4J3Y2_9ACTN|nr:hypothetical protein [Actinomadura soli]TMQ91560.1 hypothetical protein ETD83_30300 [Actinomadura soli]
MSKRTLAARTAAVALAAALGLGVAGPAASAATAQSARTPAAVQQAEPWSAELQQAIAAGKVPAWLKRVITELRKSAGTFMALRKAARKGYPTFKVIWNARVPKSIRKLVGSDMKLRSVYGYFRTLR